MDDRMLTARLRALWNNLQFVSERLQSSTWRPREPGRQTRAEMEAESLWTGLEMRLIKHIKARQQKIQEIEASISSSAQSTKEVVETAWEDYAGVLEKSQDILRECLEIIGALAIRTKDLDQQILYVADELIRESLVLSTEERKYYLLVHVMEDTFTKARARIIRLRFSEWTIWDLPLASHELGHVVLELILDHERSGKEDFPVLKPFVRRQCDQLIQQDQELQALSQRDERSAKTAQDWAESRVHELLADAFATYTMGPAYACSAILLRLNPATPASGIRPSSAQRAAVILGMLDWMNNRESIPRPYTDVIKEVNDAWDTALGHIQSSVKLAGQDKQDLRELAETIGNSVWRQSLRATAQYPPKKERDGWRCAALWAEEWRRQWSEEQQSLSQPENPAGKLRDVLNAAWLCRLTLETRDIREQAVASQRLARVAQDLCETIIKTKEAPHRAPLPAATQIDRR